MTPFVDACLAAPAGVALLALLEARARPDVSWHDTRVVTTPAGVDAAVALVEAMAYGDLCASAVDAAEGWVGPWIGEAPETAAAAYRDAEARRPIAAAIADRFDSELHQPFQPDGQQWWMSAPMPERRSLEPLFERYDRVYGCGEFTWAGLWTATDPAPVAHDALLGAWEIYPGPISRWHLPVRPDSRVYEIHRPEDWVELVRAHPKAANGRHGGWELPGPNQHLRRSEIWKAPGQRAALDRLEHHLVPDWAAVAEHYDAVHLSWAGLITTEGFVSRLGDSDATMLRYWFSERTHWLHDRFGAPEPTDGPQLTGRISSMLGVDVRVAPERRATDRAHLEGLLGRREPPGSRGRRPRLLP